MPALAAIVASFTVFLLLAYAIRSRALRPTEERLRYLSPSRAVTADSTGGVTLLRRSASGIPALNRILDTSGYTARWARDLERGGVNLRPGEYLALRLLTGLVAWVVLFLIGRNAGFFLIGLLVGAAAFMIPALWLKMRVSKRISQIDGQLVETISLIASGLRAGFAFAQSLEVTAKRVGPPMSVELNRMLLDVNLGASTEDALTAMNERVGSDDLDMVVTAIQIQRNTGGNLAEVLENVTETMRDRERIQGEIKTLTSQQRLTGWVLSLWPIVLGLIFFVINPSIMKLMWTTGVGIVLLGIWIVLTTMAIFTYQRILNIDV